MIKVIGIDPGLAATGIGIIHGNGSSVAKYAYGTISTSRRAALPARLHTIFTKLLRVLEAEKPDLMVVEDIFSLSQYPKSGIALGQVSGVILLAGSRRALVVKEIPVREAKRILTGNGNADKQQLEKAVRHFVRAPEPIKPFHASDALGLALIGMFRYQKQPPGVNHGY